MKPYITLLLTAVVSIVFAQQSTWQTVLTADSSEMIFDAVATPNGYAMTGFTNSSGAGNEDILVLEIDEAGEVLWSKTYGNTADQQGLKIISTQENGLLVLGETQSTDSTGRDIILMKLDQAGNILWSKSYEGAKGEYAAEIMDIQNGYLIAGYTWSFGTAADYMIAKVDYDGNLQFAKHYDGGNFETCFGATLTDHGVILIGSRSEISSDNAFAVKLDTTASVVWSKTYGGNGVDQANSIVKTTDGGFVFTGSTNSFGNGLLDYYMVKIDANGEHIWTRALGTPSWEGAYKVINNGTGYMIAGEGYAADFLVLNVDENGITNWERIFDNESEARAFTIFPTHDSAYIIAGKTDTSYMGRQSDIFLVKMTDNGNSCSGKDSANAVISTQPSTVANVTVTEGVANLHVDSMAFITNSISFEETKICAESPPPPPTPTGIQSSDKQTMVIYPNPSQGRIGVLLATEDAHLHLHVYDMKGVLVKTVLLTAQDGQVNEVIDLSGLPQSIYQITVSGSETVYHQRIIIH